MYGTSATTVAQKVTRKQNFGTTAMGNMTHFFGVLMGKEIGIPLEPVAYKGAGPLIADLSAGHASAGCGGVSDFLTHGTRRCVRWWSRPR